MADKGYDDTARGKTLSAWWTGRNKSIGRVRGFVEGGFAHLKRYLDCGRARWPGRSAPRRRPARRSGR